MACFFTQTDPDILAQCNRYEHGLVSMLFLRQALTFTLILWALAYSIGTLVEGPQNWALAVLIALVLIFFDQAIIASDWSLKGIFSEGQPARFKAWFAICLRLGLSLILASVLAVPIELAIQRGAIDAKLQAERVASNRDYYGRIEERKRELKAEAEDLHQALDTAQLAMQAREASLRELRRSLDQRTREKERQALEMHYQLSGIRGRAEGPGPLYHEAKIKKESAERAIEEIEQQVRLQAAELEKDRSRARELAEEVRKSDARIDAQLAAFSENLREEGVFFDERDGLLMRYLGLKSLHADPVQGPTAVAFSWAIKCVIIMLELMPVLAKLFFSPASLYSVRLIVHRRQEAARIIHEYRTTLSASRASASGVEPTDGPEIDGEHRERPHKVALALAN